MSAVARLRHDLGKAVFLAQGFLGSAPADADLEEALRADLLATRRGPGGASDLGAVWDTLAGELDAAAPEFVELAALVADVRGRLPGLAAGAPRAELDHLHAASARIRALCAAWATRTRERA